MYSVFDAAKKVDLPEMIRAHFALNRQGKTFSAPHCPKCGESYGDSTKFSVFLAKTGIFRFNCFRCGMQGTAIDFFAYVWSCSDLEAATRLAKGENGESRFLTRMYSPSKEDQENEAAQEKALQEVVSLMIQKAPVSCRGSMDYLESRGIDEDLSVRAGQLGLIRTLPSEPKDAVRWLRDNIGEGLLKQAGLWKPDAKWPGIAFRPLVFILGKTSMEFRLIREPKDGEPKVRRYGRLTQPFWWKGESTKTVLITSGAIDVLSCVALGTKASILGVPGCQSFQMSWAEKITKALGDDVTFCIGFDNNEAGKTASRKLALQLEAAGFKARITPPSAKDWNVRLMQTLQPLPLAA